MHNAILLLFLLPLGGAGLCMIERWLPWRIHAKWICLITLLGSLVILCALYPARFPELRLHYTVGGWNAAVGISMLFDGLAWMSCAIIIGISLCSILFAIAENTYETGFYSSSLLCVAGMIGITLTSDLFNMFVCFEIFSMSIYILIAYSQKGPAVLASFKYLMLSSVGMAFMLIGIMIVYQYTGSLSLLHASTHFAGDAALPPRISLAIVAMVMGIGVRVAFFPLHPWLPDAYTYSPDPISAMLSGAAVKISFLAVWRLILAFHAVEIQALVAKIGAFTALFAVIWALSQLDGKRLLAWHSMSQMGYVLVGFGVGTPLAMAASYAHIINHALFKSLLFLCFGGVIQVAGERNLKKLGNFARLMPGLSILFLIGACSIAGIPPFNGFISKKFITASITGSPLLSAALWLASVGTAASFVKFSVMLCGRNEQASMRSPLPELPKLSYMPLVLLASGCVLAGLAGKWFIAGILFLLSGKHELIGYPLYSFSNLFNTAVITGCGIGVYRFVVSHQGHRLTQRIRSLTFGLDAALLLLAGGLALCVLWIVF